MKIFTLIICLLNFVTKKLPETTYSISQYANGIFYVSTWRAHFSISHYQQMITMWWLFLIGLAAADEVENTFITESRGYNLRSFSFASGLPNSADWTLMGDALASSSHVRLTRDQPTLQGAIWSNKRLDAKNWEMTIGFQMTTTTSYSRADGMAIWFTEEPGLGQAYGGPAKFKGLGIIVDTYANKRVGADEALYVVINDGTKELDSNVDGENLAYLNQPSCVLTLPKSATTNFVDIPALLIRYVGPTLTIYKKNSAQKWDKCIEILALSLPTGLHVGVTAHTGDLSSLQEVNYLKVYELDSGNDESRALFPPFQFLYPNDGITSKDAASIFWTAFKLAFYASLVGCVLFGCYLLYGHYSKDLATNKRFY